MIFFKLSINYYENLPDKSHSLIKYHNNNYCIRCGQRMTDQGCNFCCEFGKVTKKTILYKYPYCEYQVRKKLSLKSFELTDLQKKSK